MPPNRAHQRMLALHRVQRAERVRREKAKARRKIAHASRMRNRP